MTTCFLDFEFDTTNGTFAPRPETEILVEKACELFSKHKKASLPCNILDIGTGCGNIAISLTKYIPSSRIAALDISDTALRIARENAKRHGVEDRIEFIKSNLFDGISGRYKNFFDMAISNPPYVSLRDLSSVPQKVKDDPYIALYGGADGLKFFRRIVVESPLFLKNGGILLTEIGYNQAKDVRRMLESSRFFKDVEFYKDYSGIDRIVKAVLS